MRLLGARPAALAAAVVAVTGVVPAHAAQAVERPVTAACTPGSTCTATPPPGVDNAFTVQASGGSTEAVLEAQVDGGAEPDCQGYRERSADWIRFGFVDPAAGATWTKTVTLTGVHPLPEPAARRELHRRQICFAAPYPFPTAPSYRLTGPIEGDYQGVLPRCGAGHHHTPRHANPCVVSRTIVPVTGGFAVRLAFRVPAGELDPRGKS
jgi:hypothetical protein